MIAFVVSLDMLCELFDEISQLLYFVLVTVDHLLDLIQSFLSLFVVFLTVHQLDPLLHGVESHDFGEPAAFAYLFELNFSLLDTFASILILEVFQKS